jgi:hypothetical protein
MSTSDFQVRRNVNQGVKTLNKNKLTRLNIFLIFFSTIKSWDNTPLFRKKVLYSKSIIPEMTHPPLTRVLWLCVISRPWGSGDQISGDQNRRFKVFMIKGLNFFHFLGD